MKRDLIEVLLQCQMSNAVRVIIITGSTDASGRGAFCAGDDTMGKPGYTAEYEGTVAPAINPGHDSGIGTYNGLRHISQEGKRRVHLTPDPLPAVAQPRSPIRLQSRSRPALKDCCRGGWLAGWLLVPAVNLMVRKVDKIVIAAMQGFAIQTGFSLALACDFRIADTSARMGSATLRFALLPDEGGQFLLVQHLGIQRAMDFLMRKKIATADEAYELGLLHCAPVPPEALLDEAMSLARELAAGPQVAMRLLKKTLYNSLELSFEKACDDIATATAVTDHHPDASGAVQAFREGRPAVFNEWLDKAKL